MGYDRTFDTNAIHRATRPHGWRHSSTLYDRDVRAPRFLFRRPRRRLQGDQGSSTFFFVCFFRDARLGRGRRRVRAKTKTWTMRNARWSVGRGGSTARVRDACELRARRRETVVRRQRAWGNGTRVRIACITLFFNAVVSSLDATTTSRHPSTNPDSRRTPTHDAHP